VCAEDADTVIPNTDTLADLSCTQDQIARFNLGAWECADESADGALGGGVEYFSDGEPLGRIVFYGATSGLNNAGRVILISDKGYLFNASPSPPFNHPYLGTPEWLFFSETGCTGNVFVNWGAYSEYGYVFGTFPEYPPGAYYIPRGTVRQTATQQSYFDGTDCVAIFQTDDGRLPAFPNDEAITGVSNTAPAGPFRIGIP